MNQNTQPRILVIRRRYLGDLVLLSPVLSNLRLQFPHSHLAILVDEKYHDVQKHNPNLNEILYIPQRRDESYFSYILRWLVFLRRLRRRFDVVYDLTLNSRINRLVRWTGANHRVGYRVEGHPRPGDRHYNVLAEWTKQDHQTLHISELYLKVIEADGIPTPAREIKLHVPPAEAKAAQAQLRATLPDTAQGPFTSPLVIVHPGARLPARCWPTKNFAALCDAIQNHSPAHVLLLAGPGEEHRVREVISTMSTSGHRLESPASVPHLAALLQAADLFIGNDSGPMHVAAAVGTPVAALFGAQSTVLWHPAGVNNTILQPSLPCKNCLFPSVCRPPDDYKMLCIQRITIEEAIAATLARLQVLESTPAERNK